MEAMGLAGLECGGWEPHCVGAAAAASLHQGHTTITECLLILKHTGQVKPWSCRQTREIRNKIQSTTF